MIAAGGRRIVNIAAADITGAALYLASDASRMVTGRILPVDGGFPAQ